MTRRQRAAWGSRRQARGQQAGFDDYYDEVEERERRRHRRHDRLATPMKEDRTDQS